MLKELRRTLVLYSAIIVIVAGIGVAPRLFHRSAQPNPPADAPGEHWFGIVGGLTLATLLDPSQDLTVGLTGSAPHQNLAYRLGSGASGVVPVSVTQGMITATLPAGIVRLHREDATLRGALTSASGQVRALSLQPAGAVSGAGDVTVFSLFCVANAVSLGSDLARQVGARFFSSSTIYFPVAAIALLVCLLARDGWMGRRAIQKKSIRASAVWREFVLSINGLLAVAGMGILTIILIRSGATRFYTRFDDYGLAYFIISIPLYLLLQDMIFYWLHRALHTKLLYRLTHQTHHISTRPTPMTTFQISAHEVAVTWLIGPIVLLILPLHPLVLLIAGTASVVRQVIGHLGHEIFPRGTLAGPFRWSTTVTHHDMHHQYFRCNYGLYFSHWDWLMGTMHPDYRARFDAITAPVGPDARADTLRHMPGKSVVG